jgi:predicted transcriptional regulator
MALAAIDKLSQIVTTEDENERTIAELEKLDTRGRPLTPEEERLAALMSLLIRQFEGSRYPLGHCRGVARSDGVARAAATRPDSRVWVQQRRFGRAQWEAFDEQDAHAQTRRVLPRPGEPVHLALSATVLRRVTMYCTAKQTMTIDALAAAADRDRTWIVNESLTAYIETQRWQIEHIRQGLREADAGKFASARAVKQVVDRLRRK